jgi:hypothetical protein
MESRTMMTTATGPATEAADEAPMTTTTKYPNRGVIADTTRTMIMTTIPGVVGQLARTGITMTTVQHAVAVPLVSGADPEAATGEALSRHPTSEIRTTM